MQQQSLLATKLYIPHLRPELISRPRLIEQLNGGLSEGGFARKLTLVSAPAGFGKTTLVSEWVEAMGGRTPPYAVAWLSLDEGDNDPARFLAYLIAALQIIKADIGKGVLSALQSPQPPAAQDVLTGLINEIAAIPNNVVLILDDHQIIKSSMVDKALAFLLERLPPQMHLVIATREDPHVPLARLRARGQLTEVRASDLRFTSDEAAEFLNQAMGLDLSAEDIAVLEGRTEGWVAGLQLAALSMQGRRDTSDLVKAFAGTHRYVLDYLVEEVLEQQPESIQSFLLRTAILDRLTGTLCDAVRFGRAETPSSSSGTALSGPDNGQAILELLEHANLFIVPLDGERRWYRYHRLFADLLRRRLHQAQPEKLPVLHQRACGWYEQHGFADEAIEHALHAEDFVWVAQLLEEHLDALWGRGEHSKLRGWLNRLPEEVLFSKPHISIFQARYQCLSGHLDEAERTLTAAEQALGLGLNRTSEPEPHRQSSLATSDRVKLRGRAAATRALVCSYRGDVPGIVEHARQALEYLPGEDLTWRSVTALILGNAHGFKGDMTAAYQARFEALKACEAAGDIYFIMIANLELAITLRAQGQLQRTIEICQQQMQVANENGLSQTKIAGWLLAIWGETLAELNDLAEAVDRAKEGFRLTRRSGDLQMIGWSSMCLIRTLLSRGDLADAEETIRNMEQFGRESDLPPWIANQMRAWQARLWQAQDRLEPAAAWAQEQGLEPGGEPIPHHEIDFFSLFDYVVLARILIAQGRLDEAAKLLPRLLEAAEMGGHTSRSIEILILQALAFQAGGDTILATDSLERALFLAEPDRFVRIFVDEGPPMARLLYEAVTRGIAPEYAQRLLAAFPTPQPEPEAAPDTKASESDLVEPLSERELEVLHLIGQGLTNREIASRLFLSLNTVKAHTRNIYGKLSVHSRTQAIARSQALGILPHQ